MHLQTASELEAIVQKAAAALHALDSALVCHRPSPDRWTIKEVVGHLIDSAANNHQRFIRAQYTVELVFPKYDQNDWVHAQDYNHVGWHELIDFWQHYNRHLVHVIRNVPPASLTVRCLIGDYEPMTLQSLIEDYVTHLKHHLSKIAERVGADWKQSLSL